MIQAYGGKCLCCGEEAPEFLTIDHIHGGGTEERKRIKGGQTFYAHLKKHGWPKDRYRLLCANCNGSIGRHGYCPHQSSAPDIERLVKNERQRARGKLLRKAMVEAYGGKCECCGETALLLLMLDHIEGGGTKERNAGAVSGAILYRRLQLAGWPRGKYRLLCENCNLSRAYYKRCPHIEAREVSA